MTILQKFVIFCLLLTLTPNKYISEDIQGKILLHQNVVFKQQLDLKELNCLATAIVFEASNQSIKGQIAVAQITLNRSESNLYPHSICKVISQPYQYSWYDKNISHKIDKIVYNKAYKVAEQVMRHELIIPELKDALYFHSVNVNPKWKHVIKVATIQDHVFYRRI